MTALPPALQTGDTVGIVSTARKVEAEVLQPAVDVLESWGLKVKLGQTIGATHHQHAGDARLRAEDFNRMLRNKQVKAILCARGGNGTVQMVDDIDLDALRRYPKWVVGFSDVTVLHAHIHRKLGLPTLHAAMPFTYPEDPNAPALDTLRKALFGEPLSYSFPTHSLNRHGKARGILTGGNLSTLFSISGTPSEPALPGRILFIEEVDEHLYHLDRIMHNLRRGSKLAGLSALVVGSLTDIHDDEPPYGKTAEVIIAEAVETYAYPVVFNFPSGHIKDNCALILGTSYLLENGKQSSKLTQQQL